MIALVVATALAVGLDEHVGDPLPVQDRFVDPGGHQVKLGDIVGHGKPVVLVMAYARCEMLCSVVLRGVATAIDHSRLAVDQDFIPLVVSLDPDETTGEAGRRQEALVRDIHGKAWPYLVGDDNAIHELANVLGFRYAWDERTRQFAHPAVVFVITPDGRIAEYVRGVTFDGLDDAIDRAARGELTTSTARDLLRCFHDDPARRRYESRLQLAFRIMGAVIVLALFGTIAALVRWERRSHRPGRAAPPQGGAEGRSQGPARPGRAAPPQGGAEVDR